MKAIRGAFRTDLSGAPQFLDASCFDVIVPGVLKIPIEVIVICFWLKAWIPVQNTGCSTSGRLPHLLPSEKSLSKICMFQPKERATV